MFQLQKAQQNGQLSIIVNFEFNNQAFENSNIKGMLCSLCLNHKNKCIQLPCNHNLCIKCFSKYDNSQNTGHYQCQTCLQIHEINLQQTVRSQNNSISRQKQDRENQTFYSDNINKDIFCWSCYCSISLKQYIKGAHHQHKVQTYDEAIPQIKNLMLEQLQKSLSLKDYLQEIKMHLQNNKLKKDYYLVVDKVNDFFDQQVQLLQYKKENILQQLQLHYNKSLNQVNDQFNLIHPLTIEVNDVSNKISAFLADKAPITLIDPVSGIMSTLNQYQNLIKNKKIQIPQLPNFIIKSNIKDFIQKSCQLFQKSKIKSSLKQTIGYQSKENQQKGYFKMKQKFTSNQKDKNSSLFSSKIKQISFYQPKNSVLANQNRKVRLVQKVKGKMRYSSSFCSTTFA